jgi:hypothetical protein
MENNKTTTKTTTVRNQRKNKQWLRSRDQRKHPKIFSVQMVQLKDGSFHLLGGGANVAISKNQHSTQWASVDVRDLATEIRMNGIRSF